MQAICLTMMFWYSKGNREEIMRRVILACALVGVLGPATTGTYKLK
jgi:hypothetical protein